jgi:hypothetical protein
MEAVDAVGKEKISRLFRDEAMRASMDAAGMVAI